jgi:rhodanese-related sulfurtransferase
MKTISTEQLRQRMDRDDNIHLINTLPADKFEDYKIDGSINIPQDTPDFAKRVEQRVGNKNAEVILYCANKGCDSSTKGAKKLEQAGFSNVVDYEVGAEGWNESQATANR